MLSKQSQICPCSRSPLAIGAERGCCGQRCSQRAKARLGDALIAQSCIDQSIPLITRDRDFRAFATAAKLNLVLGPGAHRQ